MHHLSRKQLAILVALTLVWGVSWPVMKLGVSNYPPLTFRALSMWPGLPVLALGLVLLKVPFRIPRAAILGYTMPAFSAVPGALFFASPLGRRAWTGVGAAALGVLLLWHELTHLAGRPVGVLLALVAAAFWALGAQELRRTRMEVPALAVSFWMTVLTAILMAVLAWMFEAPGWTMPGAAATGAIVFNAVLIFGFAHAAWTTLARGLPPVASTLSVMLIPVLGVFSGALWLGEAVHWQDGAAVLLMMVAIASVLWPARAARA